MGIVEGSEGVEGGYVVEGVADGIGIETAHCEGYCGNIGVYGVDKGVAGWSGVGRERLERVVVEADGTRKMGEWFKV